MAFSTLVMSGSVRRMDVPVPNVSSITITHNFSKDPEVVFKDGVLKKAIVPDDVTYVDANTITVTFDTNRTGSLILLA